MNDAEAARLRKFRRANCGDCVALVKHMHTWEYRHPNGGSHTVRADGVCLTCYSQHPPRFSEQDNMDWIRGSLWRHDAVHAAELVAITAGIAVRLRKEKVTA